MLSFGTLQSRDDGEDVQVVGVALPQAAVASLPAGQHRPVRLDHEGAVLTANHLTDEGGNGEETDAGNEVRPLVYIRLTRRTIILFYGVRQQRGSDAEPVDDRRRTSVETPAV